MVLAERRIRWWVIWLVGGAVSAVYLLMGLIEGPRERIHLLPQLYVFYWAWRLPGLLIGPLYVLKGAQLLRVQMGAADRRVPLASATAKRNGGRWAFRWKEGRVGKALSLSLSPAFSEALERALAQSQQEGGGRQLERVVVARDLWQPPGKLGLYIAVVTLLMGAAIWTNQPWWMVPVGPLIPIMVMLWDDRQLFLASEGLWMVAPGKEPYLIPLEAIREVNTPKRGLVQILTADSQHPEIKLTSMFGSSDDFLAQLRRQLAGEPAVEAAATPVAAPTEPQLLRCALCGRPVAELPPGARPDPKAVQICELCGGKARVQAAETGHGLAAKEQRPI